MRRGLNRAGVILGAFCSSVNGAGLAPQWHRQPSSSSARRVVSGSRLLDCPACSPEVLLHGHGIDGAVRRRRGTRELRPPGALRERVIDTLQPLIHQAARRRDGRADGLHLPPPRETTSTGGFEMRRRHAAEIRQPVKIAE